MCEGFNCSCVRSVMFSMEFMKFLYGYQKDDFKPKAPEKKEVRFQKPRSGKLAEVYVTEKVK